jgi:hypothetical protein
MNLCGTPSFPSPDVERHMTSTYDGFTVSQPPSCVLHPTYANPMSLVFYWPYIRPFMFQNGKTSNTMSFWAKNVPKHKWLHRML